MRVCQIAAACVIWWSSRLAARRIKRNNKRRSRIIFFLVRSLPGKREKRKVSLSVFVSPNECVKLLVYVKRHGGHQQWRLVEFCDMRPILTCWALLMDQAASWEVERKWVMTDLPHRTSEKERWKREWNENHRVVFVVDKVSSYELAAVSPTHHLRRFLVSSFSALQWQTPWIYIGKQFPDMLQSQVSMLALRSRFR